MRRCYLAVFVPANTSLYRGPFNSSMVLLHIRVRGQAAFARPVWKW